jgi:hypothetical protein
MAANIAGKVVVLGFATVGAGQLTMQAYQMYKNKPTGIDLARMESALKDGARVTAALEARLGPPLQSLVLESGKEGENDGGSLRTAKVSGGARDAGGPGRVA